MEHKDQFEQFSDKVSSEQADVQETADNENSAQTADNESAELQKLESEIQELKDKYLRQAAEFDNFRKRNAKERLELMQTAGKEVITDLLEVLDDCERAEKQFEKSSDLEALRSGSMLIFNKLRQILQSKGLKSMDSIGHEFDADQHEAITAVPAPNPEMSGKVIDEVEKGYLLNDKIIRFAKVVVGK